MKAIRNQRTMESLKLWTLYVKPEGGDEWFFMARNYWEIKIDDLLNRHQLIDSRQGIKNTYKKVLEDVEGNLADENDMKGFL